ncbi:MAG: response regulator [Planctomycetes bacterium]|nr:response regulator [Planctomycetota bacterium]
MNENTIRILLVDDNPGDIRLVELILTDSDQYAQFFVDKAKSLSETIKLLANNDYDAILLDLKLPDSSGIETVKSVNKISSDTPVIVLTGLNDEQMGLLAIKNGATDYIVKGPLLAELLIRTILYALARKQAAREIRQAMEMKSRFISMVSHELRAPLTAIREGIAIVVDGSAGQINPEQKDFLSLAKRNVERLTRLINDVLDFQKLEIGKMNFNMQPNNINEAISEVHKIMLPFANEKGLTFSLELDKHLPEIQFDRDKIIQVLTNLANNAIKFTEKGGITVTSSQLENTIKVSVCDTGCGIRQENVPKLFCTFEQLTEANKKQAEGTGLGLAISRNIIEEHSGKILAESELGTGSTFYFLLPIDERRHSKRITHNFFHFDAEK